MDNYKMILFSLIFSLLFFGQCFSQDDIFLPELLSVDISDTLVEPGDTISITYKWVSTGSSASISHLTIINYYRLGETGFFNPDGGLWVDGNLFQSLHTPNISTTLWTAGKEIVTGPYEVKIPENLLNGVYTIFLVLEDRSGRIKLGQANIPTAAEFEADNTYEIGFIQVARGYKEVRPSVKTFSTADASKLAVVSTQAKAITNDQLSISNKDMSVTLDRGNNFALRNVKIKDVEYKSDGLFPAFTIFGKEQVRINVTPSSSKLVTRLLKDGKDEVVVSYEYGDYALELTYKSYEDHIAITARPVKENQYKTLNLTGGGHFLRIDKSQPNSESAYILSAATGGKLYNFANYNKVKTEAHPQSWAYIASFVGIGADNTGLIVRCPQYGAVWCYGNEAIDQAGSLFVSFEESFRPDSRFEMPLPEKEITIQLVPVVKDVNDDGIVNWVDMGVMYRDKFIRKNIDPDMHLHKSIVGKIRLCKQCPAPNTYDMIMDQIREIDFATQVWWLVGAHTPPGGGYVYPPYSVVPDQCHNGAFGYDYYKFKADAEKAGARIGLHELFQDVAPISPDFNPENIKLDMAGNLMGTWGGCDWVVYAKALNKILGDGSFYKDIDAHFANWQVRAGDTWHWDCLTAVGGRRDYSIQHPSTNGTDFRDSIKVLQYIKSKGIHITSEGLQEGTHEFCDFSWHVPTEINEQMVPLVPVLFQGKTFYAYCYSATMSLVLGGKATYEPPSGQLDAKLLREDYIGRDVFWQKVALRTVKNMIKTETGWIVEYTEGGRLKADTVNDTFELSIDGQIYTPKNPPLR